MGLLSKSVKDAIIAAAPDWRQSRRVRQPAEWKDVADNLILGNERLLDKIDSKLPSAGDPVAAQYNRRNGRPENWFEWGGVATGTTSDEPYTSFHGGKIVPRPFKQGSGVFFHTHPNRIKSPGGANVGSWLSDGDLDWAITSDMGITSLDQHGGLGMALVNPKAEADMAIARKLTDALLGGDVRPKIKEAGGPRNLFATSPFSGAQTEIWEPEELAAPRGIGLALKDANILTHYSYTPQGMSKNYEGERVMAPMIEASRKLAEMFIRPYLAARGFKDGKIDLIIAAAVSSGSVGSLLAHLQREEATKGEVA